MQDIFSHSILCKSCKKEMKPTKVLRNGFSLRAKACPPCKQLLLHPTDVRDFEEFQSLKKKNFKVKLRYVGNSYAVSIPREIIDFMNESDKELNDMVDLCFEEMNRISLHF